MILLLGGTSETKAIATRLASAGVSVLVSTATNEPLEIGSNPNIERRAGRLDETAMAALVRERKIRAIVDATHPYAAVVRSTAVHVAEQLHIAYFGYVRPGGVDFHGEGIHRAPDHEAAARLAFSFGRPVLLTTGANNLVPYANESSRTGIPLVPRILPRAESIRACLRAGIEKRSIISAKGPFSVKQNRAHIRRRSIGVLVTKDSGEAGGVPAKLEAARQERCEVVIVKRPLVLVPHARTSIEDLVTDIMGVL
jgi:precorrin-6A/cobalt-precorrin-6A reductase